MLGSVTRQNVCQPVAPRVIAASSSAAPCSCISGISVRATNGKVTNAVARIRPGTAKMMRMPARSSIGPNQPLAPNSSTQTRPEITGETENGSSISVISRLRPRKRKRPMHQAAATPHTVFSGTLTAATSSVSSMAASASGSSSASSAAPRPRDSASVNTTTSGSSSSMTSSTMVSAISAIRAGGLILRRRAAGHHACPRMRRCSRLSSSRMPNETSSMTSPSAAAPA